MSTNNCFFTEPATKGIVAYKNPMRGTRVMLTTPVGLSEGRYDGTSLREKKYDELVGKLSLSLDEESMVRDYVFNGVKIPIVLRNIADTLSRQMSEDTRQSITDMKALYLPCFDTSEIIPNYDGVQPRLTMAVLGMSGSGKSYFGNMMARLYNKVYPDNTIYIVSFVDEDSGGLYQVSDNIHYLTPNEENFSDPETMLTPDDFCDSLVIFDDIENRACKDIATNIYQLRDNMLNKGRHNNISVISIFHNSMGGVFTRTVYNESEYTVIFPRSAIQNNMSFLTRKLGLTTKDAKGLINKYSSKSRWVCFHNKYPMYIVHEHGLDII